MQRHYSVSHTTGLSSSPPSTSTANKTMAPTQDGSAATSRPVKRRAAKACRCCRARKVRCNVTEYGAPCTNCRLDEVECVVSESRRKKKWNNKDDEQILKNTILHHHSGSDLSQHAHRRISSVPGVGGFQQFQASTTAHHGGPPQQLTLQSTHPIPTQQRPSVSYSDTTSVYGQNVGFPMLCHSPASNHSSESFMQYPTTPTSPSGILPAFIKPLPDRIGMDEMDFLQKKGALTLPHFQLRNEMIRSFIEYVYPYLPCIDLHEFLEVIDRPDGSAGQVSLIVYQAVMFAGSAFVEVEHLANAGYASRKEARKDLFQKTRLLYDFDSDSDRLSLVQALLLLTYYYETPDDQKDTWHWMGVTTSLAYSIGLHRNPESGSMDAKRAKLWKRVWWSTYMRDRLIALGMRRPMKIKSDDYNVPMLTLQDFDIAPVANRISCVPADCVAARDTELRRQMALMCIEKAKLCVCISHVLSNQYCVLNNQGSHQDRTTMMLLPKKLDPTRSEVQACDAELQSWCDGLPQEARYEEATSGIPCLDLHRSLLHLIFFTTVSALHRPQVLPSNPAAALAPYQTNSPAAAEMLDTSRRNVRRAASAITTIYSRLDTLGLIKFLPTTGVTALLPAIIIHLLDVKSTDENARRISLHGFWQCVNVMNKLRELHAAADYSAYFLEAAIRKAGIVVPHYTGASNTQPRHASMSLSPAALNQPVMPSMYSPQHMQHSMSSPPDFAAGNGLRVDTSVHVGNNNANMYPHPNTLTPPPDGSVHSNGFDSLMCAAGTSDPGIISAAPLVDDVAARRLETFLASTPPTSDGPFPQPIGILPSNHAIFKQHMMESSFNDMLRLTQDSVAPDSCGDGVVKMVPQHSGGAADMELDEFDGLLNMDAFADNSRYPEPLVAM